FYDELFHNRITGEKVKEELLSMLEVLDKIYCQGREKGQVRIEDAMLFTILLLPWALRRFDLLNQELKGVGYHRLSKSIREELDQVFASRLNLKRTIKDKMTSLFVNMPSLQKNRKNGTWPAWLRKKSYFPDCSRFYTLYKEAIDGEALSDLSKFIKEHPKPALKNQENPSILTPSDPTSSPLRRNGGRKGNNPAFTSDKHGVFGLRKG
ncbi:MAG: hypothetical protein D3909_15980, partial [Candidatus Electrothrix sp. ATG1]|nr:hypothetical protein [Candidatus Electrothrix sp. ATG1]